MHLGWIGKDLPFNIHEQCIIFPTVQQRITGFHILVGMITAFFLWRQIIHVIIGSFRYGMLMKQYSSQSAHW